MLYICGGTPFLLTCTMLLPNCSLAVALLPSLFRYVEANPSMLLDFLVAHSPECGAEIDLKPKDPIRFDL